MQPYVSPSLLVKFLITLCRRQCIYPIRSQCTLSLPSENIRKPYGFLIFSGGRERVLWERMGSKGNSQELIFYLLLSLLVKTDTFQVKKRNKSQDITKKQFQPQLTVPPHKQTLLRNAYRCNASRTLV